MALWNICAPVRETQGFRRTGSLDPVLDKVHGLQVSVWRLNYPLERENALYLNQ